MPEKLNKDVLVWLDETQAVVDRENIWLIF